MSKMHREPTPKTNEEHLMDKQRMDCNAPLAGKQIVMGMSVEGTCQREYLGGNLSQETCPWKM